MQLKIAIVLILSVLFFGVGTASASAQSTAVVACYDMEETAGVRYDATGNGNTLTDNNTVGYASGLVGNAASFVAANSEYLSRSGNLLNNGQSLFMLVNLTTINLYNHPFHHSSGGMLFYTTTGQSYSVVAGGVSASSNSVTPTGWHGVGVSVGGDRVSAYNSGTYVTTLGVPNSISTIDTWIGRGEYSRPWGGLIDTVVVVNSIVSSEDFDWMWNSGAGRDCSAVIAYFEDAWLEPTPTPAIQISQADVYTTTLPSGGTGEISLSTTAGDVAILAVLSVLVLLAIYTAVRGMTTSARAK